MSLRSRIVKMGNSRGIRIPAAIIEQLHLGDEIELVVEGDHLVVRPVVADPRQGWEEAFRHMAARGDDQLLDADSLGTRFDDEEWTW